MTTQTATAATLYFRVEQWETSYKDLQFEVPPGASVEETVAALKKELSEPGAYVMTGDTVCGATLLDFEEGVFQEVPGGPPVLEILAVIQTDADGEDLEGEAGLPTRPEAARRVATEGDSSLSPELPIGFSVTFSARADLLRYMEETPVEDLPPVVVNLLAVVAERLHEAWVADVEAEFGPGAAD